MDQTDEDKNQLNVDVDTKIKNYRQRYIDLLHKLNGIIKHGFDDISIGFDDHKSFSGLLYELRELYNKENEHFAEIRKFRKEKSMEAQKKIEL